MTATTTIPGSHPTSTNRALWVALACALAAVIGIAAAVLVLDDDGSSAGRIALPQETAAHPSAVSVSADAAEARALSTATVSAVAVAVDPRVTDVPHHMAIPRSASVVGSADGAERAALAERARDLRACTYSATPPDAVERCLNGG